jgi:DNA-binding CsgD family transcriptional regulator
LADDRGKFVAWCVLFGVVALLMGGDVVGDIIEGQTLSHVILEATTFAAGFLGLLSLCLHMFSLRKEKIVAQRERSALSLRLSDAQADAQAWRSEAKEILAGLSTAIDRQFGSWKLTPAEREVGMLLLKGLSMKEVAQVRSVSERTAREQARAVYRKGGLAGRAELAAFFLEDLLPPPQASEV